MQNTRYNSIPPDLAGRQAYANAVAADIQNIDQQTYVWMRNYQARINPHLKASALRATLQKTDYASTRFYGWTQENPRVAVALSAGVVLLSLRASTWKRSLFPIGILAAGFFFALKGRNHARDLGPLLQISQSLSSLNHVTDQRAQLVQRMEQELGSALNDPQLPPEEWQGRLIELVNQMGGERSTFLNQFIHRLNQQSEQVLSNPESFSNVNRYDALQTIYTTLGCNNLLAKLTETKAIYDEFAQWAHYGVDQKTALFEKMKEKPDRFAALLNRIFTEVWDTQDYYARIKTTQTLMRYPALYGAELERRRKSVFEFAGRLHDIGVSFNYVVMMINLLKPFSTVGCMIQLAHLKERYLQALCDKSQREQFKTELVAKGVLLGYDQGKLKELLGSSLVNFFKTFKRQDTRIGEFTSEAIVAVRGQLRENGHATEVRDVPKNLNKLTLAAPAFNVAPRPIEDCSEDVNLLELCDHLDRADQLGLIPDFLVESISDNENKNHNKKTVLDDLGIFLKSINNPHGLNGRLSEVRRILRLYTAQFRQRIALDMTSEQQREIYRELVSLIAIEIGFATYHCEDRKLNAALMIYREKLQSEGLKDESVPKKVQQWAAKQRDSLVSQIIYELVMEASQRSGFAYDIASRIGFWRYALKDELALGNVPEPAYNLDYENPILNIKMIRTRFEKTYTAQWLFEKAKEDHQTEEAHRKKRNAGTLSPTPELSSSTIYEYLEAVITNFDKLSEEMFHEESFKLLDRGLALYLQETGLLERTV
ncbi:MAG: hypothetical protein ABSA17_05915 [Rhabdochlamydiaceae bacterium]|jgi:hypothetical protein